MEVDNQEYQDSNVGIAFALVIGAGAATALGAGVVFVPRLVKYASRRTLAASLGLSAGVMTYVSFVEIFQKSNLAFVESGLAENKAYMFATVCFFSGVVLMVVLNYVVTWLLGGHHHHHHDPLGREDKHTQPVSNDESAAAAEAEGNNEESDLPRITFPCCSEDPARDLENVQHMAEEIDEYEDKEDHHWEGHHQEAQETKEEEGNEESGNLAREEDAIESVQSAQSGDDDDSDTKDNGSHDHDATDNHKLMRMSVNTAVAIALHNFPEGLATFVAALYDPGVGAMLAIAIAIHNVPEGLCVAMPIYYATGQKWKAFLWGVLSGISEPLAALLGWAVLASVFTQTAYAILFGLVSGMMVIISAKELLPTAHRYDPEDTVVTYAFMIGMAIMALSLVLFQI